MAATSFFGGAFFGGEFFNGSTPTPVVVVDEPVVAVWRTGGRRRLTKEELAELVRQQRIALGILPPDLPGQAIDAAQDIAKQVADAVEDIVQMSYSEFGDGIGGVVPQIDRRTIYKASYLEAEYAIHEYKRLRKRRRAARMMLMH